MVTRAKFKVDEIRRSLGTKKVNKVDGSGTEYVPVEQRTLIMSPVYADSDPEHENTKFWDASPSGRFELTCVNLEAVEQFELGKEYYIDITRAPE